MAESVFMWAPKEIASVMPGKRPAVQARGKGSYLRTEAAVTGSNER
ncbi:hypothetical protein I4000191A8_03700 [Clostridia bacterium i40-0019-1A8]